MDHRDFFYKRFRIPESKTFNIGDEVIDNYGTKGIVTRKPYYFGNEEFVYIFKGYGLSSTSTKNLTKTNKHYKEMEIILKGLMEA